MYRFIRIQSTTRFQNYHQITTYTTCNCFVPIHLASIRLSQISTAHTTTLLHAQPHCLALRQEYPRILLHGRAIRKLFRFHDWIWFRIQNAHLNLISTPAEQSYVGGCYTLCKYSQIELSLFPYRIYCTREEHLQGYVIGRTLKLCYCKVQCTKPISITYVYAISIIISKEQSIFSYEIYCQNNDFQVSFEVLRFKKSHNFLLSYCVPNTDPQNCLVTTFPHLHSATSPNYPKLGRALLKIVSRGD